MRVVAYLRLILLVLVLVAGWQFAGPVQAQVVEVDPRAASQSPADADAEEDEEDEDDDDEESPSVQRQMQTLKRELRGQKADPSQTAPVRDGEHQFQIKVPNYVAIRNRNIVMQQRDFSCGAACLATICTYYWGVPTNEEMVLRPLDQLLTRAEADDRIENGLAMSDLRRAAVKMGYQSVVGKTTFEKLGELKVPVIVGIQPGGHKHFVVLKGTFGDHVYFADPIRGNIRMPNWEFVEQWQEKAILVVHKPGEKVKKYSALSLTEADIFRTQLNDQIIRSQEARQPQTGIKLNP